MTTGNTDAICLVTLSCTCHPSEPMSYERAKEQALWCHTWPSLSGDLS